LSPLKTAAQPVVDKTKVVTIRFARRVRMA
jgi:hypothetical protein